jgi:hypothetical protein
VHATHKKMTIASDLIDFKQCRRNKQKTTKKKNNRSLKKKVVKITIILFIGLTTMKLGSGIFKHSIQNSKDEDFHYYNSLILTNDLAF